jgi:hypothetical protein
MSFIAEAEEKGFYDKIKRPEHIRADLLISDYLILGKAALEARFNRKFSYDEVEAAIEDSGISRKREKFVHLPDWYFNKWLRKRSVIDE